jgi:hypothetical protein
MSGWLLLLRYTGARRARLVAASDTWHPAAAATSPRVGEGMPSLVPMACECGGGGGGVGGGKGREL